MKTRSGLETHRGSSRISDRLEKRSLHGSVDSKVNESGVQTTLARHFHLFMRLPPEIRIRIYDFHHIRKKKFCITRPHMLGWLPPPASIYEAALLRTCRTTNTEATPIFYRSILFHFSDLRLLKDMLSALHGGHGQLVRTNITAMSFGSLKDCSLLDVKRWARGCTRLSTLHFEIALQESGRPVLGIHLLKDTMDSFLLAFIRVYVRGLKKLVFEYDARVDLQRVKDFARELLVLFLPRPQLRQLRFYPVFRSDDLSAIIGGQITSTEEITGITVVETKNIHMQRLGSQENEIECRTLIYRKA